MADLITVVAVAVLLVVVVIEWFIDLNTRARERAERAERNRLRRAAARYDDEGHPR